MVKDEEEFGKSRSFLPYASLMDHFKWYDLPLKMVMISLTFIDNSQ